MNRSAAFGLVPAFALALSVWACDSVEDAPTSTTISGRVIDESGSPIPQAEVTSEPATQTVQTGDDGRFVLDGARFTISYQLTAVKEGFRNTTEVITPTAVGPNEVTLTLPLQVICTPGEARCTPGGVNAVEVCTALGNAFGPPTPCAEDQTCIESDGRCSSTFRLRVTGPDGLDPETMELDPISAGVVTSSPAGINCGASCVRDYPPGSMVSLTAVPLSRGEFVGWGGDCAGTAEQCLLTMDADRLVLATFTASEFPVEVQLRGPGDGRVTSMPAGIDCPSRCSAVFDRGTQVTFTATPDPGSEFETWQRDCSGASDNMNCVLTVDNSKVVRARFQEREFSVTVSSVGDGAGTVVSEPQGINCGGDCQEDFTQGTQVTLTATPMELSTFEGWTGGGCGADTTCRFTVDQDVTVSARFEGVTFPLDVTTVGVGTGRVTSNPGGIDCGANCSARFPPNTSVTLQTAPDVDSGFWGWQGDCSGTEECTVTMGAARTVSARFEPFFLFPLAADADCVVGLSFDGGSPLAHRCGMGAAASLAGAYQRVASRAAFLDRGYAPDDATGVGHLDVGRTSPTPPTATFELTVRRIGTAFDSSGRAVLMSDVDTFAPAGGVRLLALDDGSLAVQTWANGSVAATATAAAALTAGQWFHVAATVDTASGLRLFVDGQQVAATMGTIAWTASSSTAWVGAERVGATSSRHRLNGAFDEVRLSRGARY